MTLTQLSKLENLFGNKDRHLNYEQIDDLVKQYQQTKETDNKDKLRENLLAAFHNYIMKYVQLLTGHINSIRSYDTLCFLALFISSNDRSFKNYLHAYEMLKYICADTDEEELYQEFSAIFLKLLNKFEFRGEVSFSAYIVRYMRWDIKDWVVSQSKEPVWFAEQYNNATEENQDQSEDIDNYVLPSLDLAWVHKPNSNLFTILNTYERFLLYLYFKEDFGIRQIAKNLGKANNVIGAHLQHAIHKLQKTNKKENQWDS